MVKTIEIDTKVDREKLGRMVREVWVGFSTRKLILGADVPPHHLYDWDKLGEDDKEVDRQIGEQLYIAGFVAGRAAYQTNGFKRPIKKDKKKKYEIRG